MNLIVFTACISVGILAIAIGSFWESNKRRLPPPYEYSLRTMRMAITAIEEQIGSCDTRMEHVLSASSAAGSYMEQRQILVTRLIELTVKMQEISDRAARLPEGDEKVPVEDPYFDIPS